MNKWNTILLPFLLCAAVETASAETQESTAKGQGENPAAAEPVTEAAAAEQAKSEQLLRAQIKARYSTMISSEMSGRIDMLKIRDGERFQAGQVLVGFHCDLETAQLSKAKATLEKKRKTHEVDKKLAKLNSISTLELDVAKTEEEEASSEVRVAVAIIDRCVIKAPFSGKVVEVTARAHQSVKEGDPLLEIVNDKDLEVEFIAPSRALPNLKIGRSFSVTLDETKGSYSAEIVRLGGRVDPVSQTIKVYGRIKGDSSNLLPGMSGSIELAANE